MIVKEYNIFEKGINAIVVASKAISKMHIGRIDYETTSNIGHIEGGSATNIVTDEVTFTAEIRSHSMEKLAAEVTHMADYSSMHHLYYQLYYNGNQPILSDSDSHHQYLRPIIRHYVDAHHTQTSIYG